jgi:iron complex outermembrane receptor protein
LEIEGKWDSGLLVRGSYTYQRAENGMDGLRLPNSPENMVKLQLIAPIWGDKLSLGIEGLYASERIRYDRGHTDAMWLLNTTLYSREIVPNMEISASVYNVLNSRYGHAVGTEHKQTEIEQDGRTFQLKLNYKF